MKMPRQTGISFDSSLMDELRNVRADLQKTMTDRTINNTDIMRYLLGLHDKYGKGELAPKVEIAS